MKIRETATLLYYDGPRLVLAADERGTTYLADLVSEDHEEPEFLVVRLNTDQLFKFLTGETDLRSLLVEAGEAGWFLGEPLPAPELELILVSQTLPIGESDLLPGPDVRLRCSREAALEIAGQCGISEARFSRSDEAGVASLAGGA